MTVILLLAVTTASHVPAGPDSTYLNLVGELPQLGSFSYSAYSGGRRTDVHRKIRDVQIDRCTLSFEVWVQQITDGAMLSRLPHNFMDAAYTVPLNGIDSKRLNVRSA